MAKLTKVQKRCNFFNYITNFKTIDAAKVDKIVEIVAGFKDKNLDVEVRKGKVVFYCTTYHGFACHDTWDLMITEGA